MTRRELGEIGKLPEKYRPLGAWAYFGYSILFLVPVIGWVFMAVFALSDSNLNRRGFARSFFCFWIVLLIFAAVMAATLLAGSGISAAMTRLQAA